MILQVIRYSDNGESTQGLLMVDGEFQCHTLEDEHRSQKLKHETRIPEGEYKLGIRDVGGFHNRYLNRYGDWHKGMIEVLDVPNFEYILIHCGNDDDDTSGCLLVGNTTNNNNVSEGFIGSSRAAYKDLYDKVIPELLKGNEVIIKYEKI